MQLFESVSCLPRANSLFREWKSLIESMVPCSIVEHIGSTAIDGALTKGDIDLYVEVPKEGHPDAVLAIESKGFKIKQDTHRDAELCMLVHQDVQDLAIQLVARGSKYSFFLRFRDALNANKKLVEQYNYLKVSCANESTRQYRECKAKFIEGVLSGV